MNDNAPSKGNGIQGARLEICLAKVGKTATDLATKLGASPSSITRAINGETSPNPKTVSRWIEALRDWGLEVSEQFFYVPWEYVGFYDPRKTEQPSALGGSR